MSDISLFVVNAVVAIVALLTGFTFIGFLCGSCAAFMLIVAGGSYRSARARGRKASPAS